MSCASLETPAPLLHIGERNVLENLNVMSGTQTSSALGEETDAFSAATESSQSIPSIRTTTLEASVLMEIEAAIWPTSGIPENSVASLNSEISNRS